MAIADDSRRFASIIAQNPTLNASLDDGHALQEKITSAANFISANPRLYANQTAGLPAGMVPERPAQDNSDLPTWTNADAHGNLVALGVPKDLPIFLQVWIKERENFFAVAPVMAAIVGGTSVSDALK